MIEGLYREYIGDISRLYRGSMGGFRVVCGYIGVVYGGFRGRGYTWVGLGLYRPLIW